MAVFLLFSLLYIGVGVFVKSNIYDAKMMVEIISGAVSSLASTSMNGTIAYRLPSGVCTINITEDYVRVNIPPGLLFVGKKTAELQKEQAAELKLIRPDYITIKEKSAECDPGRQRLLLANKVNDEISFEVY